MNALLRHFSLFVLKLRPDRAYSIKVHLGGPGQDVLPDALGLSRHPQV